MNANGSVANTNEHMVIVFFIRDFIQPADILVVILCAVWCSSVHIYFPASLCVCALLFVTYAFREVSRLRFGCSERVYVWMPAIESQFGTIRNDKINTTLCSSSQSFRFSWALAAGTIRRRRDFSLVNTHFSWNFCDNIFRIHNIVSDHHITPWPKT